MASTLDSLKTLGLFKAPQVLSSESPPASSSPITSAVNAPTLNPPKLDLHKDLDFLDEDFSFSPDNPHSRTPELMSELDIGEVPIKQPITPKTIIPTQNKTPQPEMRRKNKLSTTNAEEISNKLYEKGKKLITEKQEKSEKFYEETYSFKPQLDPKSIMMVKYAEKEGRSLVTPKKKEKANPQPNPEENKQAKTQGNFKDFIKRNYDIALEQTKERKNRVATPPDNKVTEDCTFQPKIDDKSKQMPLSHKKNLYDLADQQKKDREKLIEEWKNKKEEEELKQCTFAPTIIKKTNNASPAKERQSIPSIQKSKTVNSYSDRMKLKHGKTMEVLPKNKIKN